jgi:hypothetical protein
LHCKIVCQERHATGAGNYAYHCCRRPLLLLLVLLLLSLSPLF